MKTTTMVKYIIVKLVIGSVLSKFYCETTAFYYETETAAIEAQKNNYQ